MDFIVKFALYSISHINGDVLNLVSSSLDVLVANLKFSLHFQAPFPLPASRPKTEGNVQYSLLAVDP